MARIVNVHEAKTHLSKLLEQAHAGQEIIFAKEMEIAPPMKAAASRRTPK
jgi:antitoxin (DNA-binding transcriptional repressor) of toxin-antitoxin stability system